jgi:hypothetical protein
MKEDKLPAISFSDDLYDDAVYGESLQKYCNKKFRPSNIDMSYDTKLENRDVWFIKRDFIPEFFRLIQNIESISINIVTNYSDYETDDSIANMKPKIVGKVFSPNVTTNHPDIISIPLGFGPKWNPTTPQIEHIKKFNTNKPRTNLLYVNFRPGTYQHERGPLMQKFVNLAASGHKWVTIGTQSPDPQAFDGYLTELTDSKFCLCPRGNGIDTHRLWESLYCRTIPIVRYENAYRNFRDLPILFVNDWSEVTEELLHTKYEQFLATEWNYSKLRASWWGKQFNSFESGVDNEKTN